MSKKNKNQNVPADNVDKKRDGCRGGKAKYEQKERETRGNPRSRNWWEEEQSTTKISTSFVLLE